MSKLPRSPDLARLRGLPPALKVLPKGTRLHRIYRKGGEYPVSWNQFRYYGPLDMRFDHHIRGADNRPFAQDRGIAYFALDGVTPFAEVFQEKREVDRKYDEPWFVTVEIASNMSLLDLSGGFCVDAGCSKRLLSGPRMITQSWSRGFYDSYKDIHGLYYPSSLHKTVENKPVVALYERALSVNLFAGSPVFHRALCDAEFAERIRNACDDIGYVMI